MKIRYSLFLIASITLLFLPAFSALAQDTKVTTTAVCRFMTDPDNTRTTIAYIPANTELTLLGTRDNFLLVLYNDSEGYISAEKTQYKQIPSQNQQTVNPSDENTVDYMSPDYQQARYEILVEKYGEKVAKSIFNHKIWKGISHNMVRDSWGKPLEIRRTINSSEISEEWIYAKHRLVFINDALTHWGPVK